MTFVEHITTKLFLILMSLAGRLAGRLASKQQYNTQKVIQEKTQGSV